MFYAGKITLVWNEVTSFSLHWCAGLLFAFLFTSSKTFISLGHPDRYIEYMVIPALLIMSQSNFFSYFNFGSILLIHLLFYILINVRDLRRIFRGEANDWERKNFQTARDYLTKRQGRRIIFIPMKLALHFADIHNHKYLWATTFVEPYVAPSFFDETFELGNAPFPKSLKFLKNKHNLDAVAIMNIHLQKYERQLKDLNAHLEFKTDNLSFFNI
jgi:vacuolar-type H+-ATPase subunit C/Vma6